MKVYAAIGHFKDNKNMVCVAMTQLTKKAFMQDCMKFTACIPNAKLAQGHFLICHIFLSALVTPGAKLRDY